IRDHRDEPASRLPAKLVGHVPSDLGRHVHVHRHHRIVPDAVPAVRAIPAYDRDQRSEGRAGIRKRALQGAGGPSGGGEMNLESKLDVGAIREKLGIGDDKVYGVIGEFSDPHDLVKAGRKIREMGYTKLDAMSPFPVHGIDDAIGVPYSKLGW